jgi:hypothetical protein
MKRDRKKNAKKRKKVKGMEYVHATNKECPLPLSHTHINPAGS